MTGPTAAAPSPRAMPRGWRDSGLILPHVPDWAEPVWHLYVVRSAGPGRAAGAAGRGGDRHADPLSDPAAHAGRPMPTLGLAPEALPLARALAGEVLSLPIGPHMAAEAAGQVITRMCGE